MSSLPSPDMKVHSKILGITPENLLHVLEERQKAGYQLTGITFCERKVPPVFGWLSWSKPRTVISYTASFRKEVPQ